MGNRFLSKHRMCRPVLLRRSRPVCMLRKGLVGGVESGESSSGNTLKPTPEQAQFAANVLRATGPLLSVLVHFFEYGCWGSPEETSVEGAASHCRRSALWLLVEGRSQAAESNADRSSQQSAKERVAREGPAEEEGCCVTTEKAFNAGRSESCEAILGIDKLPALQQE